MFFVNEDCFQKTIIVMNVKYVLCIMGVIEVYLLSLVIRAGIHKRPSCLHSKTNNL